MKKAITTVMMALSYLMMVNVAEANTERSERVLIVVSELQTHGSQKLRNLYTALEELTRFQTNLILGDDYKEIIHLRQGRATLENFKTTLKSQAARSDVKAIDVIMSLHGATETLYFREGAVAVSTMLASITSSANAGELAAVNRMKSKLRMIYNLSCFGRSHNQAFRAMGFDITVGSNGVNANSEAEYTAVLTAWSFGSTFAGAFNATNNDGALAVADGAVRLTGIDADSRKFFRGNTDLKIGTDPH